MARVGCCKVLIFYLINKHKLNNEESHVLEPKAIVCETVRNIS